MVLKGRFFFPKRCLRLTFLLSQCVCGQLAHGEKSLSHPSISRNLRWVDGPSPTVSRVSGCALPVRFLRFFLFFLWSDMWSSKKHSSRTKRCGKNVSKPRKNILHHKLIQFGSGKLPKPMLSLPCSVLWCYQSCSIPFFHEIFPSWFQGGMNLGLSSQNLCRRLLWNLWKKTGWSKFPHWSAQSTRYTWNDQTLGIFNGILDTLTGQVWQQSSMLGQIKQKKTP